MNSTTTLGLDLAKEVFQVHGIDAHQNVTVRRQLRRKDVLAFFARLPACLVGMEACGGAHYWAREIGKLGHTIKVLAPRDVKGRVKRVKTDAADAEAICAAATERRNRSVPVKSVDQQCLLMLHKTRSSLVEARTKSANQVRAHLSELGIIAPKGHEGFARLCAMLRDETCANIPPLARLALMPQLAVLGEIERGIAALDARIRGAFKSDPTSRRLEAVPGIGTIGATAFSAVADDVRTYPSGRSYAASVGITPRITGTGGEVRLGPITKQGNGYLRRLLYLGAKSRLGYAKRHPDKADPKLLRLLATKKFNVAAIALANTMARTIWALLTHGGDYIANHQPVVPAARAPGCR